MKTKSDAEELNKIFLESNDWECNEVVKAKFLWASGLLHKIDTVTKPLIIDDFLKSVKK